MVRIDPRARAALLRSLVDPPPESDFLVQEPAAGLKARGTRARIYSGSESAEHVGMTFDVRLVGAAGDRESHVRIENEPALDEQDVVPLRPERSEGHPGVLHDHPAGKVSELAEIRVVDLEVIRPVGADVPVRLQARPAHVHVVARVGSVRRAVLVDLDLRLDEYLKVESDVLGRQRHGHGVGRRGNQTEKYCRKQARVLTHPSPSVG